MTETVIVFVVNGSVCVVGGNGAGIELTLPELLVVFGVEEA